ncbi:MAG: CPBP family intramembrane metalloprotease [Propionibacteriaceae bacterium]|nr:CPBP family intramembrane metalloprotease [Propionibacteriaceae bacterium]
MAVVVSAVIQAALFLVVPFVWWLASARRAIGFFAWLGWKRLVVARWTVLAAVMVGAFLLLLVPVLVILPQVGSSTATSQFHGLGWAGLPGVVAYALLQTAFAEESLFRGFLLKRIAAGLGFRPANAIQASLFGLLHAVPFGLAVGAGWGVAIGFLTGAIGALMGYVNERLAGGSLVPSWTLHAAANLLTGCLALASLA